MNHAPSNPVSLSFFSSKRIPGLYGTAPPVVTPKVGIQPFGKRISSSLGSSPSRRPTRLVFPVLFAGRVAATVAGPVAAGVSFRFFPRNSRTKLTSCAGSLASFADIPRMFPPRSRTISAAGETPLLLPEASEYSVRVRG